MEVCFTSQEYDQSALGRRGLDMQGARVHEYHLAKRWLTDRDVYANRVAYFSTSGMLRGFRTVVFTSSVSLGIACAIKALAEPTYGIGPLATVIRLTGAVVGVGWGIAWAVGQTPTPRQAVLFTFSSSAAIAMVSYTDQDAMASAVGLSCLGATATFAAFMLPARTSVAHLALTTLAVLALIPDLWASYGVAISAVKVLILLGITVVIPLGVQLGLALLARDATRSYFDPVSGALSRRGFLAASIDAIEGQLSRTMCVALFVIDLDDFKNVNDTYGHGAGDIILMRVAEAVRDAIKPASNLVGRLGGDEFAVVALPNNESEIQSLLRRIQDALAAIPTGGVDHVGASVGFSHEELAKFNRGDTRCVLDRLIAEADKVMYQQKTQRRRGLPLEPATPEDRTPRAAPQQGTPQP